MVEALMGIWMIRREHIAGHLPVTILTDSQVTIKRTKLCKATTAQYLFENNLDIADDVNLANADPTTKCFQLVWILGHSRVRGNERVDEEAKKVVQGDSSSPHRLPLILREELPRSIAAVKQGQHMELMSRCKYMWLCSP